MPRCTAATNSDLEKIAVSGLDDIADFFCGTKLEAASEFIRVGIRWIIRVLVSKSLNSASRCSRTNPAFCWFNLWETLRDQPRPISDMIKRNNHIIKSDQTGQAFRIRPWPTEYSRNTVSNHYEQKLTAPPLKAGQILDGRCDELFQFPIDFV